MAQLPEESGGTTILSEADLETATGVPMTSTAELAAHTSVATAHHSNATDHTRSHDILDASDHTVGALGANYFPVNVGGAMVSSSGQTAKASILQATSHFVAASTSLYPNISYGSVTGTGLLLLSSGLDQPMKFMIRDRANTADTQAIVMASAVATGTTCNQDVATVGFWDIAGATFYPLTKFRGDGDIETNIGINGQECAFRSLTEETTIAAAATTDTTINIPQYAQVYGVSVRVTTVIPTAATFTVGTAATADLFSGVGRTVSTALNTTDPCTAGGVNYFNAATAVRITPTPPHVPATATGKVRVTIHYIEVTPPTS